MKSAHYILSALLLTSFSHVAFAEDSSREKVIRNNTLGYDSQERAIAQDRQNRRDNENFNSNQFGSALDFVNRMEQRSQARVGTGREGLFECMFCTKDEEDNYLPFQRDHDDIWMKLFDDEPIGNLPNYAERAFFAIEYKLRFSRDRENSDHDRIFRLDERRPLEIAKAGFLLGLREPGVYKPDPKRALKILNRLIMEDGELYRAGNETDAPQLNFLLGMIYLNGAGIAADPQKALDYFKLATEWKSVMIDDNHGKKRKIHYTSEKYVIFSNYAKMYMARNGIGMEKSDAKARHIARETLALIALKRSDMPEKYDTVYIGDDDKLLMWNDVGDMMEQEAKSKYGELIVDLIKEPDTEYLKAYIPSVSEEEKLHPKAYPLLSSGRNKTGNKDYNGAIADFNLAINVDPKYTALYRLRSKTKEEMSDYKGALNDINTAIKLEPNVAYFYEDRANIKIHLRDWAGNIANLEKAVALDPNYQPYKDKLVASKKSDFIWNAIVNAEEKSNPQAHALLLSGIKKADAADYQGAIADFNGAIKADPKFSPAYKRRGLAKGWLSDNKGWLDDINTAIALETNIAYYYDDRALVKSYLKDYAGSIADWEKAVTLDLNNQAYKDKLNNAKSNLRWNMLVSAEEKSNPQAHALFQSGIKKNDAKDYRGAIADFTSAIEADPKFSPAYKRRGDSRGWLDDDKGWLDDINAAISMEPNIASFYAVRGNAKSYLKDWVGQLADYEKAVALDPNNQGYKDKLNAAKNAQH